ncbi:hypothetical protein ACGFNX_26860 [Streptomyces sp. NPDC048723]|uniref:hypothetical protein n=1 Tax=unclassified Streptomyces TaxID=2593676 RepID=UPI003567FFA0
MMSMMRSTVAAAAALALTMSLSAAAHAAGPAAPAAAAVPQVLPIGVAVSALPIAAEDRTGYQRTSFRHWNAGDIPADGCDTRVISMLRAVIGAFSQRMRGVADCAH